MNTLSRRTILTAASAMFAAPLAQAKPRIDLTKRALAKLEERSLGRLGACILDTATGHMTGHRVHERFAMCSTFKLPLAAAILQRADRGTLSLDTVVPYTQADMVFYAPVTEANLGRGGMTVRDLAEAGQKKSDNVAANLLLKQLGGPAAFTQFFRELGDTATRLDRYEPDLNASDATDERDTTTPAAMAATLRKILTGDLLKPASRELLIQWMIDTGTGTKRIRAGLPKTWRAGDKTGTGLDGKTGKYNDVAIAWPPEGTPVIVTAYLNVPQTTDDMRDDHQAILAEVARIAAEGRSA
ncbi:MAG: class A beta-lactamase [Alphaproteobacteria bacterium]|nr:class A beta-lactamase [Alphaproteobacteria bacterium]